MRHKGLLIIACLVAVPALGTLATWIAWEAGAFDAPALPGFVEVSALYRRDDVVGFSLRSVRPRTDLVGYTAHPDGATLVLQVWRRRLLAGKRRTMKSIQVEERLAPPLTRIVLRAPGYDGELQIWPRN